MHNKSFKKPNRQHGFESMENVSYLKRKKKPTTGISNLELHEIQPLTDNQEILFEEYLKGKNIVATGSAGSGKSYCLLYLMMHDLLYNNNYEKIVIFRSAVPIRNLGFLPGSEDEKLAAYELPYKNIFNDLFGRSDAYEILKKKDLIEFQSTSYIRGITLNNSLLLVDEWENCNFHELDTLVTRCGKNTKIHFSGDIKQTDFDGKKDVSGFHDFISIIQNIEDFHIVNFNISDCVRNGIVLKYLQEKDRMGF
jgi:phosphate starvation-inducible protein PhoH